jgi:hypothetical protein
MESMGTDITIYFESLNEDTKQWVSTDNWAVEYDELDVPYSERVYHNRNYRLFAMLAGERNEENITPFAEPRGLPEDTDKRIKDRIQEYGWGEERASYFTLAELLSFDWWSPMRTRALVGLRDWHFWQQMLEYRQNAEPQSWCKGTNSQIINETEAKELIAKLRESTSGEDQFRKQLESDYWRTYVRCEWTRPRYVYVDDFFGIVIPHMLSLGKPENVRMIFCFG